MKKGVRAGVAKFKRGRRKSSSSLGGGAAAVMSGVGVNENGPQTVRYFLFLLKI